MNNLTCIYCGSDTNIVREHVIPAVYFGTRTYDDKKQWIVEACDICNGLAGAAVYFSIPEKAKHILKRYSRRFRKVLRIPNWTPQEIEQMGYKFRVSIEHSLIAKRLVQGRIAHLEMIAEYPRDFLRPKWVDREYQAWKEREKERLAYEKKYRATTYGNKSAGQIDKKVKV